MVFNGTMCDVLALVLRETIGQLGPPTDSFDGMAEADSSSSLKVRIEWLSLYK